MSSENISHKNPSVLCLFTAYAPYGKYEVYIKNELPFLKEAFEEVYIFSRQIRGDLWELPEGVVPVDLSFSKDEVLTSNVLAKYFFPIMQALFMDLVAGKKTFAKIRDLKQTFLLLLDAAKWGEAYLKWAEQKGIALANTVHYSNWFIGWTESLGMLKSKDEIRAFLCRAHGYDLYPSRRKNGYIPFRPFHLKWADKIISVSGAGFEFLKKNFSDYAEKFSLGYLGVEDKGLSVQQPDVNIRLVSCSNMIPLKRIHRIMGIIEQLNRPVHWVHFGSGELEDELKKQAAQLPERISYEFPGRLPNDQLLAYYNDHHIDFLINVSTSEGLPVSIMEAISMAIPIVATDVGGTREIVNSTTGLLIPAEFDDKKVARQILAQIEEWRTPEYREGVRAFWQEHFYAVTNFDRFIQILKQL